MSLHEMTGKRVSAFSREHRPAENGGDNHLRYAKHMDAIDGDLDLVCHWSNCRATLAVIETTTREDQHVTYRRGVAERLGAAFFHIQEVQQVDGTWLYRNIEPRSDDLRSMDDWIAMFEVPLRVAHGCRPWALRGPYDSRTCQHLSAYPNDAGRIFCSECGVEVQT